MQVVLDACFVASSFVETRVITCLSDGVVLVGLCWASYLFSQSCCLWAVGCFLGLCYCFVCISTCVSCWFNIILRWQKKNKKKLVEVVKKKKKKKKLIE